jgi:UTP:GlnB (protein PII) uridylyltransferase
VEHLVRHQRVLLRLALRDGPGDDRSVRAAAGAVGDLATLRLFHSLTVAEVRAGGGPRRRLEDRVRLAYRAVERELWRSG